MWFAAASVIVFLIAQLTVNASIHAVGGRIAYNTAFIMAMFLAVYALCGSVRGSSVSTAVFLVLFATVDYYVLGFRGRELVPTDVFSFRTAMNVAGEFNFIPGITLVFSWIQLLQYAVICMGLRFEPRHSKLRQRSAAIVLTGLLTVFVFTGVIGITPHQFGGAGSGINGFLINFTAQVRSLKVEAPEGYSDTALLETEEKYQILNAAKAEHRPDIIVIMNESFADLSVLGSELRTEREVMPFLNSLTENTVRGYALSSVFGGDTANSEYEFLTGNTMFFLPRSVVPYHQYIQDKKYSLAWFLKENGYYTLAMHPFHSSGWMRTTVYPLLGFDEYEFLEAFPQKDLIRGFVSDREMYGYLISRYEELTSEEEALFVFGVTMQNHGGYEYDGQDFENTVSLSGYRNDYPRAEQYLSLIHESDAALKELIEYFGSVDREVILLFYGDHLPSLEEEFFQEIHGGTFKDREDFSLKYKVPYIIWANYDIEEESGADSSINYLSAKMLEAGGVAMNSYHSFY